MCSGGFEMKASIIIPYKKGQEPTKLLKYFKPCQKNIELVTDNTEGISKARNNCIAKAKGDIIIFLDSDCFPITNDWLSKIIEHTEKFGVSIGKTIQQSNTNFIQAYIAHKNGFGGTFTPLYTTITPISVDDFSPMTNIGIQKDILSKVGKFDGKLFAGEDIDYMMRLKQSTKVYFIPDMVVEHEHSNSISSFLHKLYNRRKHYLNDSKILKWKHGYSAHYKDAKRKMLLLPVFTLLLITVPFVYLFNRFRAFDFIVYFVESVAMWRGLL